MHVGLSMHGAQNTLRASHHMGIFSAEKLVGVGGSDAGFAELQCEGGADGERERKGGRGTTFMQSN